MWTWLPVATFDLALSRLADPAHGATICFVWQTWLPEKRERSWHNLKTASCRTSSPGAAPWLYCVSSEVESRDHAAEALATKRLEPTAAGTLEARETPLAPRDQRCAFHYFEEPAR